MEFFPKVLWIPLQFCLNKKITIVHGRSRVAACSQVEVAGMLLLAHCRENLCSLTGEMRVTLHGSLLVKETVDRTGGSLGRAT